MTAAESPFGRNVISSPHLFPQSDDRPRQRGGQVLNVHGPVSPWTVLPDTEVGYWTVARGWEIAPTLWPPRKADLGREREKDNYVFVHLEVESPAQLSGRPATTNAAKAERALADYQRAYGRRAWVFLPLRFAVGVDSGQRRVPTRGYLAQFLAIIGEPGRFSPDTLDMMIGWGFRVKVHTAAVDHEQDEKPMGLRFTKAVKILEARQPRDCK